MYRDVKLTWKRQPLDARDRPYRLQLKAIPKSKDLRKKVPYIENQLDVGSCVGNAVTSAEEYLWQKTLARFLHLSRLFSYWTARELIGETGLDSGCYIRDAIKQSVKLGIPLESIWPYDTRRVTTKPSSAAYKDALTRQVLAYYAISTLQQMKDCIASGIPFVGGVDVYSSFWRANNTGTVPMPNPSKEDLEGGHAIMFCGYNDTTQRFWFANSWGAEWGNKGFGSIPYKYVTQFGDDFWAITKTELM